MADGSSEVIEIDLAEWRKLKVGELRKNVGELGLETKGTKSELITRVEKYLNEQEADLLEEEVLGEEDGGGENEEEEEETGAEEVTSNNEAEDQQQQQNLKDEETEETKTPEKKENGKITGPGGTSIPVVDGGVGSSAQAERLKSRQERFGTSGSVAGKKQARAERFGLVISDFQGLGKRPGSAPTTEEVEKMKKRAGRFGTAGGSLVLNKIADNEKKQKRIGRFGLSAVDLTQKDRQDKRKERFGD